MVIGVEQQIHRIQDVKFTVDNNEPLYLGYATSSYIFGAGVCIVDDGYVLGIVGQPRNCYTMPKGDTLKSLQKAGLLPDPLPSYRLTIWQYAWGYSLWLFIGLGVAGAQVSKRWRSAIIRKHAAEAVSGTAPLETESSIVEKIVPLTGLAPLPFLSLHARQCIAGNICVLCGKMLHPNHRAYGLVGRHRKTGAVETQWRVVYTKIKQECMTQAAYLPVCVRCVTKYRWFGQIAKFSLLLALLLFGGGLLTMVIIGVADIRPEPRGLEAVLAIGILCSLPLLIAGVLLGGRGGSARFSRRTIALTEHYPEWGIPGGAAPDLIDAPSLAAMMQQNRNSSGDPRIG